MQREIQNYFGAFKIHLDSEIVKEFNKLLRGEFVPFHKQEKNYKKY